MSYGNKVKRIHDCFIEYGYDTCFNCFNLSVDGESIADIVCMFPGMTGQQVVQAIQVYSDYLDMINELSLIS